jgi:hypothetical protein
MTEPDDAMAWAREWKKQRERGDMIAAMLDRGDLDHELCGIAEAYRAGKAAGHAARDAEVEALRAENERLRGFQAGVDCWMDACFGATIKADQLERADRFVEEALELAQTMLGFGPDRARALVDYVFNRPVGDRHQEVGGVMVTLAALCNATGLTMQDAGADELARVWTKVEAIRAKQAAKPTGSALPVAALGSRT